MDAPLEGIRVLDLSRVLAGPFCCMVLGDMDADVVKVERVGRGDDVRSVGLLFLFGFNQESLALTQYSIGIIYVYGALIAETIVLFSLSLIFKGKKPAEGRVDGTINQTVVLQTHQVGRLRPLRF